MFIGLGLSAVVPIIHGLFLYGFERLDQGMGLTESILEGVMYITGAVIYAVGTPILGTIKLMSMLRSPDAGTRENKRS